MLYFEISCKLSKFFNRIAAKGSVNKFAGKEVTSQENDPIINEMKDLLEARGLNLRVIEVHNGIVTIDASLDTKRVNIYIEKLKDDKWIIDKDFDIG